MNKSYVSLANTVNGKKKALCIGINYFGKNYELKGCINDATNMRSFLRTFFGYGEDDIVMLTDDQSDPQAIPTRENILHEMGLLVKDAQPGDLFFFHYSGHGDQKVDDDLDEADGYDESICPVDWEENGYIMDDEMNSIMISSLPSGCHFTAIFDSCHSGTALDLSYTIRPQEDVASGVKVPDSADIVEAAVGSAEGVGARRLVRKNRKRRVTVSNGADKTLRPAKSIAADCICWSGCKDSQLSNEMVKDAIVTGAMSNAFIAALSANPHQTYRQLLQDLKQVLGTKYCQEPQLSSSHPIDASNPLVC